MTAKLYQQNVYTRSWDARITSVTPHAKAESTARISDTARSASTGIAAASLRGDSSVGDSSVGDSSVGAAFDITLDQTAFFPEGGGQSCDLGMLGPYQVIDVQENGEEVIHTVQLPDGMDGSGAIGPVAEPPQEGMSVHCSLDWDRRFDNMQRHCGEHILSGIFYARCGGVNRGFHMGEDYMTIDISLEDDPTDPGTDRPASIDMDLALECEKRANQVVWSDAPVTVFRFEEREEAEKMPLRKALAFDEDISIVCVGSPENAADCVACCGTHPATAGQVGLIKIYKVENYKNMFRIYFEAGARALADYDHKHAILTDLSNGYSSSIDDFPDKLRAQEEKLAEVKDQLYHTKKALIGKECAALDAVLSGEAPASSQPLQDPADPLLLWPLENLSLDDAFDMAKRYMKKAPKLILLYAKQNTSFILVSAGDPKCGQLVREYASFYQGKGGGNDVSARAIFTSEENAMLFADLLGKHLR
ncbi:MAG: alanyl-tRNA editing protein [Firmicutes bacterium]|nr:alanyl-tRNA editing protein [Bacillota bacterium]